MLVELIVSIAIIAVVIVGAVSSLVNDNPVIDTLLTTVLLTKKFTAINTQTAQSFEIKQLELIETGWMVSYDDCELGWASTGNTYPSGTCRGKLGDLRLRVGEGGIGYPWEE